MQCPNQTKSYWISHEWRGLGTLPWLLGWLHIAPKCTTLHCVGTMVGKSTTVDKIRLFWLMGFKFFTVYLLIQKSWIVIHFYRNLMEARTFITWLLSLLGKFLLWWYNILLLSNLIISVWNKSKWKFWKLKVQNCNLQSTRKINKRLTLVWESPTNMG